MKNLLCLFLLATSIGFGKNYLRQGSPLSMVAPFHSFQDDEIDIIIDGTPYISSDYKSGFRPYRKSLGSKPPCVIMLLSF